MCGAERRSPALVLVEVEQDAPPVLLNDVSVSSDTQDPFADNNTDQEETGVIRPLDED